MDKLIADFFLTSEFGNVGVELALALHQTVLQIENLADALVLLEVGGLRQYLAVIVHPAEHDVAVRMSLVIMAHNNVRSVDKSHLLHIVLRHFRHKFIGHPGCVSRMEVERDMTDRFFDRLPLP